MAGSDVGHNFLLINALVGHSSRRRGLGSPSGLCIARLLVNARLKNPRPVDTPEKANRKSHLPLALNPDPNLFAESSPQNLEPGAGVGTLCLYTDFTRWFEMDTGKLRTWRRA